MRRSLQNGGLVHSSVFSLLATHSEQALRMHMQKEGRQQQFPTP